MVLGIYTWIGFSILNIYLSARASSGSVREGFKTGIVAGTSRLAVSLAAAAIGLKVFYFPGAGGPISWLGPVLLLCMASMPVASFSATIIAYQQSRDVPAAQEEKAGRPLTVWLPVAIVDGVITIVGFLGIVVADPW